MYIEQATIVLHGANDTNVAVVEAEQVVNSLKQHGVPVKFVLFQDEGHGWRKVPNRIQSTVEITGWSVKYLGDPTQMQRSEAGTKLEPCENMASRGVELGSPPRL